MPEIKTMLAELFGFQQFEPNAELQNMIDDTLSRYDDDHILSTDDLAAAAGGLGGSVPDGEKGGKI